jgi:hypothetical protein
MATMGMKTPMISGVIKVYIVDRVFVLAQPRGFSPPALFLPSDFGWFPIVSIILPGFRDHFRA